MRVNFFATLRSAAGRATIEVNAPVPSPARAVLEMVTCDKPPLAAELWQRPGELKDHIHVFINGRETRYLPQGLETLLETSDTLDVFPPVGGGASAVAHHAN